MIKTKAAAPRNFRCLGHTGGHELSVLPTVPIRSAWHPWLADTSPHRLTGGLRRMVVPVSRLCSDSIGRKMF